MHASAPAAVEPSTAHGIISLSYKSIENNSGKKNHACNFDLSVNLEILVRAFLGFGIPKPLIYCCEFTGWEEVEAHVVECGWHREPCVCDIHFHDEALMEDESIAMLI